MNTHHLTEQVERFVEEGASACGVEVRLFHEERLLGSAGTLRAARRFAAGEESFFIIYADNLSEVDLGRMARWHSTRGALLTMGLFRPPRPERCGVAVLDEASRVVEFVEKPARPRSPWAAAGVYVARRALFERLDEAWSRKPHQEGVFDLGRHVLPLLAARGEVAGYRITEFLVDIGTPEGYAAANRRLRGARAAAGSQPRAVGHALERRGSNDGPDRELHGKGR